LLELRNCAEIENTFSVLLLRAVWACTAEGLEQLDNGGVAIEEITIIVKSGIELLVLPVVSRRAR
jgi:hypothetical protein